MTSEIESTIKYHQTPWTGLFSLRRVHLGPPGVPLIVDLLLNIYLDIESSSFTPISSNVELSALELHFLPSHHHAVTSLLLLTIVCLVGTTVWSMGCWLSPQPPNPVSVELRQSRREDTSVPAKQHPTGHIGIISYSFTVMYYNTMIRIILYI